jgi:alpha-amylase/alpha-mannosidase (GH57 family)
MASKLHVAFVWHMHQPLYKDRRTGRYLMPWVRLHAQKDYVDMLDVLKAYPNLRQTFNLVPSLLEQVQDYAEHEAWDRMLELLAQPEASYAPADWEYLLERGFDVHWDTMGAPHPRYAELHAKREILRGRALAVAIGAFTPQDWADLVTWFNLAWFDPSYLRGKPVLAALVAKDRGFTQADREGLVAEIRAHLRRVVPAYKELAAAGQIELTTTPYYHPILPLLCDTESARVARPDLPLPRVPFRAPEDARRQIDRGIAYFQQTFGHRPRGMWPSEQSVSPEAAGLIAQAGLSWAISDEQVLGRTLDLKLGRGPSGVPADAAALYQPYRLATPHGDLAMVFRDVVLSDLIGFSYQRLPAPVAAEDLHKRLDRIRRLLPDGDHYLVTIALDGENCWESYVNDGADFLHAFYDRVSRDQALDLTTVGGYLEQFPPRRELKTIHAGSWIGADFTTWIGDPTKNLGWEALGRAREALMGRRAALEGTPAWAQALDELDIAEGSDWFWWYGEGHDSGQDALFDLQFRLHLQRLYELVGLAVPDDLTRSLYQEPPPPTAAVAAPLAPTIDGKLAADEWAAAATYDPAKGQGAMHAAAQGLKLLRYGAGDDELYLCLEFGPQFQAEPGDTVELLFYYPGRPALTSPVPFERGEGTAGYRYAHALRVSLDHPSPAQFRVAGEYDQWQAVHPVATVARQDVLELALPLALLDLPEGQDVRFVVALMRGEQLLEIHPRHEGLALEMPALRTLV